MSIARQHLDWVDSQKHGKELMVGTTNGMGKSCTFLHQSGET